ncbi:hypothetical protein CPC08DRAFT_423427 [Agrocybe pediades]|nr:hypothetical protein CPC08DRAFT_423427 [Agrocybe pediades]
MTASEPPTAGTINPQQPWNGAPGRQSTAPSVRTAQEYAYSRRGRPSSDMMSVSTKISQFDLLSTPYVAAQSVRSGKEGERRQVREKESYLSVIKEDPSSRGNTPSSDRHFAGSADGHGHMRNMPSFGSVAQPPFAPALQNRTSVATMNSSATNKRNSRRPPAIAVPEPDEELEPFGVAYDRHAQANGSSASLNSRGRHTRIGADLSRRPSRISEKTTPDTSIVIDVVPPSGFAPDVVRSPPHTGRNHLSPYHTYQPTPKATPRVAPAQSMASLRTQGGTKLQEPSALLGTPQRRPESRAESQKTPSEELKDAYMREHGSNYAPSPRVQRPPSSMSHAPSHISQAAHKSTRSLQLHTPRPEPTYTPRRYAAESIRPESVRSPAGFSTKNPSTTNLNLNNNNPYLVSHTYRSSPKMSQVSLGSHINNQPPPAGSSSAPGPAPNQSTGGLVLQPPIRRERSNASLRSNGSFSRFIPDDYQDPAFWGPNGPGDAPAPSSNSLYGREQMAMRAGSANSGLSYTD